MRYTVINKIIYQIINFYLKAKFWVIINFFPKLMDSNPGKSKAHWNLVFEDDFKKLNPDYNFNFRWGTHHPTTLCHMKKDAIEIIDNKLHLKAIKKKNIGWENKELDYMCGYIDSYNIFSQKYGRWEIRCKLPKGSGLWPAFWLIPLDELGWPPEIDIFENMGKNKPKIDFTNHWEDSEGKLNEYNNKNVKQFGSGVILPNCWTSFNHYALEWEKGELRYYVNDILCAKSVFGVSDKEMYFIVNNAISKFRDEPNERDLPNALIVDYIRVYKKL